MSEAILKALMRMFAILAAINRDRLTSSSREIVEMYLNRHLSRTIAKEYLKLFDDHYESLQGKHEKPDDSQRRKRNASHSVKVLAICQQVNEELHQKEKVIVLMRLIEFMFSHESISQTEQDFIITLAGIFSVEEAEFKELVEFASGKADSPATENTLLIASSQLAGAVRFIRSEGLNGSIRILKLKSINIYFMKFFGSDTLYLRGQDVKPGLSYVLESGGIIRGNRIKPIYYTAVAAAFMDSAAGEIVSFSANQVEFNFPGSTNGLHRFNFSETTGTLVGVMGGSGVGKSTLFSILNGSLEPQKGQILINGHDIHSEDESLKGLIGFIPQDDLLFEELTVFENLYYNACLCFRNLDKTEISRRVDELLEDLGLSEIKNLKVGSPLNKFISGGQRKRLNISLELIREPLILFVDEPTSGLSSNDSEQVMLLLKELTLKGKLIIVNIHQPSSDIYKLFDKLLVMDKGGYVIYNGNPIDAVVYFKTITGHVNADESECQTCGNVNPEQLLQAVDAKMVDDQGRFTRERKITPEEWFEHYEEKIEKNIKVETATKKLSTAGFRAPSLMEQFRIFSLRNLKSKLSNTQYLLLNLLEAPALAFILAFFTKYTSGDTYTFIDNKNFPAYLFMAVIVPLFLGMTVSAEEIIRDRKILQREKFLNLSRFSYLFSKTVFLFVLSAIQTISFVLISNYLLGVHGMTFSFWFTLFALSFFSNMVGLNISSGLNSVVTIYILIPLILVPQLLLSGVIVRYDDLEKSLTNRKYVPVVGDIMASRWAYEALAVDQFRDNPYEKHFFEADFQKSNASWFNSFIVPELNKAVNMCELRLSKKMKSQQYLDDVNMLHDELPKLAALAKVPAYSEIDALTPEKFDTVQVRKLRTYLESTIVILNEQLKEATKKIDQIYLKLSKEVGKEELVTLKKSCYNQALSDLLLNRQELNKVMRDGSELIRKKDPIFAFPDATNGRAHFFSPVKRLGGLTIDTFWFNNGVLWLMSVLMFVALYFDLLRKLVEMKFRKKKE